MRRITLSPMPTVQFHLIWDTLPKRGPVGWTSDYVLVGDTYRNWPSVVQRYWHPMYWLLWLRIAIGGPVTLRSIDPQTKRRFVASFDEEPTFTNVEEMMAYANAKNQEAA